MTERALRPANNAPFRQRFLLLFPLAALIGSLLVAAQAPRETVGRLDGDDIQVQGHTRVEAEDGPNVFVLFSGSSATVRSGRARLLLADGGEVGICGPARFSVLKSGGAVTLAFDYGRLQARLDHAAPVAFFTPLIVASPVAIADGPRDVTLGLEPNGAMCLLAAQGALRVEQQLTGQSVLLPQGGQLSLAGGQMEFVRGGSDGCRCDALVARAQHSEQSRPPQWSLLASASSARPTLPVAARKPALPDSQKPPTIEEPVYRVLMPPLSFDASSLAPPPLPSPETILLVRRARVRPVKVFRGRVVAPPAPPAQAVTVERADILPIPTETPAKRQAGLLIRIRNFLRQLASRGP